MRLSAILYTVCMGNLLLAPLSTAKAAVYEFMAYHPSSSLLCGVKRFYTHKGRQQRYGIATYDALFKYVLSDDTIRPSFLHAFVPGLPIVSSQRLDEHMNPLQKLQQLRNFLHHKTTEQTVKNLTQSKTQVAVVDGRKKQVLSQKFVYT